MNKAEYNLSQVGKSFLVNGEEHVVLNETTVSISSDDITVILGKSGCGKTTLLRMLAGLEPVSQGEIHFLKEGKETEARVGLVFQESRLMPWLTVDENIGLHQQATKKEISRYITMMRLSKFEKSYPNELSGGMAQRVSIARALSYEPDFLFMDEPFSALDYFTRMDMQKEVVRIHEETEKGVLFVTHDLDEALTIGTRILVFAKDRSIKEFDLLNRNKDSVALKEELLAMLK